MRVRLRLGGEGCGEGLLAFENELVQGAALLLRRAIGRRWALAVHVAMPPIDCGGLQQPLEVTGTEARVRVIAGGRQVEVDAGFARFERGFRRLLGWLAKALRGALSDHRVDGASDP